MERDDTVLTGTAAHGPRPRPRTVRRAGLLALALGLVLILSGCSLQSFGMSRPQSSGSAKHASVAKPASAATGSSAAGPATGSDRSTATTTRLVRGGLQNGSTVHRVDAGERTLMVNYWTTQNPATWTSALNVPIHVSAHFATGGSKATVLISTFRATVGVAPAGTVTTLRTDTGRFVLTAPYSYDTVLVLPGQPASTRSATVSVEFDLLVETAPNSHQYFRQTVLDTLPLTYVSSLGASS